MKSKFKATCYMLGETFYCESVLDLTVAVAVKYIDKKGQEKIAVGWGTNSYAGAMHSVMTQINMRIDDERVKVKALCTVEKIS